MIDNQLVRRVILGPLKSFIEKKKIVRSFRHVFGKKEIDLSKNQAAVSCLVKNGEIYIDSFIRHYLDLGVEHIFILDNGSTDDTVEKARNYENVSIYHTSLSVGKYQRLIKKYFLNHVIHGGWAIDVDIDELLDFPYSGRLKFNQFLDYLNQYGYTGVVTQMLDVFSDKSLSYLAEEPSGTICLKNSYKFYDLKDVRKEEYANSLVTQKFAPQNEVSNTDIKVLYGGIRKTLYDLDCLLTKHALLSQQERNSDYFTHVHFSNKVKLADISGVLIHYKLIHNAFDLAIQNRDEFSATSKGYSDFIKLISMKPDLQIVGPTSKELRDIDQLIEDNFVVVSEQFKNYVGSLN